METKKGTQTKPIRRQTDSKKDRFVDRQAERKDIEGNGNKRGNTDKATNKIDRK